MAKLIFAMNQSLDGYVDHQKIGPPDPTVFHHFIEHTRGLTGMVYGTRLYDIMRYWDDDHPHFDADDYTFAAAWRSKPKWVLSRSIQSVGPNAMLISTDAESFLRKLKADQTGEISIGGPHLAGSLAHLHLIDEYRIYLHPKVIGRGQPFFITPPPPLHLAATDRIGDEVIRLTYVSASTPDPAMRS